MTVGDKRIHQVELESCSSQQLLLTYRMGVYLGLKRLEDYDMAYTPQKVAALGVSPFPSMQKWLRN